MTESISSITGKAISALKPEQRKNEIGDNTDVVDNTSTTPVKENGVDTVELSPSTLTELDRAGFDEAKVAQIKQELENGNYPLDPKRIAEGFAEIEKLL
jgi:negative regulator of flagellin synthesis FlgM